MLCASRMAALPFLLISTSNSSPALCGWLADRSPNRRLPLLVGLLALGGATVMLCVGNSVGILVTGRVLQGLSAAVVWTVGLALLVDTVGQKDIGQMMGYVSMSMSLAILVAPLLGGVVYAKAGYYAVYYLAFALIFLDILLRIALVEKKVAAKWLQGPTTEISSHPSSSAIVQPNNLPPTQTSTLAVPTNPENPATRRSRLPPILSLLASRRLLAALWGCLVVAALTTAFDAVLPLRAQALFGFDSTGAGLLFLALVLPSFIAPVIGTLSDKYGPRWLTTFGLLLCGPLLVFLRFVDHEGIGQIVLLCALLAMVGLTLTMTMTPLLAEITYVVAAKEEKRPGIYGEKGAYAQAYALFNTSFAAGTLIGPLWAGFVSAQAGWGTMSWSLGLLSMVSAIPAAIWTGGLITRRKDVGKRWNHGADEKVNNENGVTA